MYIMVRYDIIHGNLFAWFHKNYESIYLHRYIRKYDSYILGKPPVHFKKLLFEYKAATRREITTNNAFDKLILQRNAIRMYRGKAELHKMLNL